MKHFLFLLPLFSFTLVLAAAGKEVLVAETFDAKTLPANWAPGGHPGAFTIADGTLRGIGLTDNSHAPAIAVPISGHNLTVDFDVKFANRKGSLLFLIDGDSQFTGQAHLLRLGLNGNQVQLRQDRGDPASKLAQKEERDARGGERIPTTAEQLADPTFYRIEPLASQTADPLDGAWHHVRIELRGNAVTAFFDDGKAISAQGTVLDVPKSRIVFLVGQNGDMRIDNVMVSNAGS
jgi:hypothetical protein